MPIILDELERIARFVEDLLLLAKAERKDFLIWKQVDSRELTLSIYAKIRALGDRKWQLDNRADGTITVDPQRIVQAILNLAQNAVQHTTTTDTITFGSAIEDGQFRLWVIDTGVGIPIQDREGIFDRFARSGNNRANSQGAGLGLSIVSAIAQSHNGCVELYSQVGKGSTFTVVIVTNFVDKYDYKAAWYGLVRTGLTTSLIIDCLSKTESPTAFLMTFKLPLMSEL